MNEDTTFAQNVKRKTCEIFFDEFSCKYEINNGYSLVHSKWSGVSETNRHGKTNGKI